MKTITKNLRFAAVMAVGGLFAVSALAEASISDLKAGPGKRAGRELRAADGEQRPTPRGNKLHRGAPRNTRPEGLVHLPGGNSVLCGAMVYNDLWGVTDDQGNFVNPITAGFYTIEAKSNGKITKLNSNQNLVKMRAGVKVNSLYYAISTSDYDTSASLSTYYTSSWSCRSTSEIDLCNVPSDLTYDPVSGNVYGFFWNDEYQEYDRFCRFDTYYGEAYDISLVDRNAFAIAANAKGEIYGIWGYTGWLIKVNPQTGAYEQIGKTGFSPGYINTMTFDDATGKLYWCANDGSGESWLLEVNTETGAATEIMHFADNASFAGIFAMPYKTPDMAPAIVEDITANFADVASTTCTISCTAPVKTYNGSSLSGPLTLVFTAGGTTVEVSDVTPGQRVESPEFTLAAGENEIEVTAATDELLGAPSKTTVWAGLDVPCAPGSVTLEDIDGTPVVKWTAPESGEHGGNLGEAPLTYSITRYPDLHTVKGVTGTEWSDTDYDGHAAALWYSVRAANAAGESAEATSPKLVFGSGFTVPFTETFSTQDDFDLWSVFDLNGQTTWAYDASAKNIFYSYSKEKEIPGDDWIISPRLELKAGKTYRLSADVKSYYRGYPENFRFALGRSCSPESMDRIILDCPDFENTKWETKRASFTVEEDGYYYLGLYDYSIAHNWQLTVDNISVEEVSGKLPQAVTALTAEAGVQGALTATLNFTLPVETSDNSALESPLQVNVYRNHSSSPAATLSGKAPGETMSWKDETPGQGGLTHYRVTVSNGYGEGADNAVEIWIGQDTAGAVGALKAEEQQNGDVVLSWTHPTEGTHGGWYGKTTPLYRIVRSDGEVLATDLDAESFTDTGLNLASQELFYYLVTPYVEGVKGQYANTPWQVFGPAITTPATETFPGADMTHYPWVSESNGPNHVWTLVNEGLEPVASDQNGDRGMAMFMSGEPTQGIEGSLSSPKFDISGLTDPTLSFWMWHTPESATNQEASGDRTPEVLTLLASADGVDFQPIVGGEFAKQLGEGGWMRHSVALQGYQGAKAVRIAFRSTATGHGSFYIDNVSIGEPAGEDVEVASMSCPERVGAGLEFPVEVTIVNNGLQAASAVVTLKEGEREVAPALTEELEPGMGRKLTFNARFESTGTHTITVTASAASDTKPANNSAVAEVKAVEAIVSAPKELSIAPDMHGGVTLQWFAPSSEGEVSDDIESHPDWAIEGFGGYRMWDLDGAPTCYINKDLGEYPSCMAPKAFQVCNAKTLGIDIWPEGTPHSGNKMLMSVASSGVANNDWLVLPMLNGAEQTVSFWAKAFTAQDTPAEKMRVLWSATGASPSDFTSVHSEDYLEIPDTWMHYSWGIPAGARWVALQCISDDAFALFIDDIRFDDLTVNPSPLAYYEILRDGEAVGNSPTPGYTDVSAPAGELHYRVRAVYTDGSVSAPSNEVVVHHSEVKGIEDISVWSVRPVKGGIEVKASQSLTTIATFADGKPAGRVQGSGRLALPAGIYILKAGNRTEKLIVR